MINQEQVTNQEPLTDQATKDKRLIVNGQPSATNTTRLNRGEMLSVKGQSHVLRHVMALRGFGTPKSCAFG